MADKNNVKEAVANIEPFDPTRKKKKKKKIDIAADGSEKPALSDGIYAREKLEDLMEEDNGAGVVQPICSYSELDYTYEMLIDRLFSTFRENNPQLVGERRRLILRPPRVLREGTSKTILANFMDYCKKMNRQPDHLMNFLLTELGVGGSLDGQQRLVVKNRFGPKEFEGLLRRYTTDYVICLICKSSETLLLNTNSHLLLKCNDCSNERTVDAIEAGFVTKVSRRNTRK